MEIFALWIICGFAASYVAGQKNKSSGTWFLLGLLLGPIALLMVGLSPAAPAKAGGHQSFQMTQQEDNAAYTFSPLTRPCPFCAEDIKPEAIVCKHCKRDVPAERVKSRIEKAYESMQQAHEHKVSKSGARIWLSEYGFVEAEIETFLNTLPGA